MTSFKTINTFFYFLNIFRIFEEEIYAFFVFEEFKMCWCYNVVILSLKEAVFEQNQRTNLYKEKDFSIYTGWHTRDGWFLTSYY